MVILSLIFWTPIFAEKNSCKSDIAGYKVLKDSIFPFVVRRDEACFFAFYTINPAPIAGTSGNGNLGDALWYGYYKINNPTQVFEFQKPSDSDWSNVCSINAVSFYAMHGNNKSDVTVIGSCNRQNAINYTFPLVFVLHGDKYILDENVYRGLYGFIGLTVADVREYIKSPESYFKVLEERNKLYAPSR